MGGLSRLSSGERRAVREGCPEYCREGGGAGEGGWSGSSERRPFLDESVGTGRPAPPPKRRRGRGFLFPGSRAGPRTAPCRLPRRIPRTSSSSPRAGVWYVGGAMTRTRSASAEVVAPLAPPKASPVRGRTRVSKGRPGGFSRSCGRSAWRTSATSRSSCYRTTPGMVEAKDAPAA